MEGKRIYKIHVCIIILISICCRSFWRTVLLPSWHKPEGNGLSFHTVHDAPFEDEWP